MLYLAGVFGSSGAEEDWQALHSTIKTVDRAMREPAATRGESNRAAGPGPVVRTLSPVRTPSPDPAP